jgi:hypothetical protein
VQNARTGLPQIARPARVLDTASHRRQRQGAITVPAAALRKGTRRRPRRSVRRCGCIAPYQLADRGYESLRGTVGWRSTPPPLTCWARLRTATARLVDRHRDDAARLSLIAAHLIRPMGLPSTNPKTECGNWLKIEMGTIAEKCHSSHALVNVMEQIDSCARRVPLFYDGRMAAPHSVGRDKMARRPFCRHAGTTGLPQCFRNYRDTGIEDSSAGGSTSVAVWCGYGPQS